MQDAFFRGVLVGLSGGADSVFLLLFLLHYRSEFGEFPIAACHVHHGIRGEEADRDAAFCENLCRTLGVEFLLRKVDCPKEAERLHKSIEETARILRYTEFEKIIQSRNDLGIVATAHNSTDNLETVLHRMLRGSGSLGLSGIVPASDKVIRPLLEISSEEIRKTVEDCGIPFVFDSTNLNSDITRNYIRSEILPKLSAITPRPEDAVLRLCRNLRADNEALSHIADGFLENYTDGMLPVSSLCEMEEAVFSRVLSGFVARYSSVSLGEIHIRETFDGIHSLGSFSISVPGGKQITSDGKFLTVIDKAELRIQRSDFDFVIVSGENRYDRFTVVYSPEPFVKDGSDGSFMISTAISEGAIEGKLHVRNKLPGDTLFYGGMHHKLKTLFNSKKFPENLRREIPIFSDDRGVLWVPGVRAREDGRKKEKSVFLTVIWDSDPGLYSESERQGI